MCYMVHIKEKCVGHWWWLQKCRSGQHVRKAEMVLNVHICSGDEESGQREQWQGHKREDTSWESSEVHIKHDRGSVVLDPVRPGWIIYFKETTGKGNNDLCMRMLITTSFVLMKSENKHNGHQHREVLKSIKGNEATEDDTVNVNGFPRVFNKGKWTDGNVKCKKADYATGDRRHSQGYLKGLPAGDVFGVGFEGSVVGKLPVPSTLVCSFQLSSCKENCFVSATK